MDLNLEQLRLGGTLTLFIGNLSSFSRISFGLNNFIGSIPHEIGLLSSLTYLVLYGNYLSGSVPSSIYNKSSLYYFTFTQNHLHGNLPADVGITLPTFKLGTGKTDDVSFLDYLVNCTVLQVLRQGVNNFGGVLPKAIANFSSQMHTFSFNFNGIHGNIPVGIVNLANLALIALEGHRLTGSLPDALGRLKNLRELYLNVNKFLGRIPSSLGNLSVLIKLFLEENNFEGNIPSSLRNCQNLLVLNLYSNKLSGTQPAEVIGLSSLAIYLDVSHNALSATLPAEVSPDGVGVNLPSTGLSDYVSLRQDTGRSGLSSFREGVMGYCYPKHTIILKDNLIGSGSFGSVYKGTLSGDESSGTVKVLNLQQRGASKSFIDECQVLRSIKHHNLLKIITAISGVDHQGNDLKALVFEYMPNGTIDVACALEYLHHFCETPIVHCDIKPSNVLLDNDMVSHVGDFGLATFLFEESSKLSTQPVMSASLRGFIGYIPPEYGMGGKPSTLGDIYNYGILLLEIFTGKRPTNEAFEGESEEFEYETKAIRRNNEIEATTKGLIEDCFVSLMQIGMSCSANPPSERMPITVVINKLHTIKNIYTDKA
ncbi:hypothetical protein ACSQ67_016453 [Phaseolus vulgaris]